MERQKNIPWHDFAGSTARCLAGIGFLGLASVDVAYALTRLALYIAFFGMIAATAAVLGVTHRYCPKKCARACSGRALRKPWTSAALRRAGRTCGLYAAWVLIVSSLRVGLSRRCNGPAPAQLWPVPEP